MTMNYDVKQLIKRNIVTIIISLIIDVLLFVISGFLPHDSVTEIIIALFVGTIITSIGVIVLAIIGIVKKRRIYNEQQPYKYQYLLEYEIYKRIGVRRKDRTAREIIIMKYEIPERYTDWREAVVNRNKTVVNNEDFYHFLKHSFRSMSSYYDGLSVILTPMEIGIMTVYLSVYVNKGGSIWEAFFTALFVLVLLTVELKNSKNEILYIYDVMEILCPKYMESQRLRNENIIDK